ncbi:MAG TPA: DUF2225 domain-containing protein [Lachnospiraceae bacterium]|nr:DUF2225 domain-containing protein [Lachnospiraceae bacterium]
MANILSGLANLGLAGLENANLYEKEEKKPVEKPKEEPAPPKEHNELDYVFGKSHSCPVCYNDFKAPTVRQSKLRSKGADTDLRPRFAGVDPLKYDVIVCPKCGYAALGRFFDFITPPQAKLVKEGISRTFRTIYNPKEVYTYDEAFTNYQLALGNAVVKKGKASEKAYLCLKMAWLLRGKMEAWDSGYEPYQGDSYSEDVEELRQDELELLNNAVEGFMNARQTETFPMCGMDESTLDYIIAVSAMKIEKYDIVSQMLNSLLAKPGLNSRMKDMCIELKDKLKAVDR